MALCSLVLKQNLFGNKTVMKLTSHLDQGDSESESKQSDLEKHEHGAIEINSATSKEKESNNVTLPVAARQVTIVCINQHDSVDGCICDTNKSNVPEKQFLKKPVTRATRSRTRNDVDVPVPRSRSYSRTRSVIAPKELTIWTLSREQKIILLLYALSGLISYLSVSLMAPFFPEEALSKGVSDTVSGWIFGISPFVQFIMSPVIGKLIPIAGVKFSFIAGMFLFSGCTILFGFLTYVPVDDGILVFVVLAFLLQIVKSIGVSLTSTAGSVISVRAFPDNISTVFGFGEIFVGLGLVSGPAVGGLLYGLGGFYLPFITIGGLGMLSIPMMLCLLPYQEDINDNKENRVSVSQVFLSPLGVILSLSVVISTFSWSILDPTLEPFLRKFHLSPEMVGVIFLVMAATYSLSAPFWGWISDKLIDQRGLLTLGFLIAAAGSLLVGPSPLIGLDAESHDLWLVIVALVVLGCSASLSSIPTFDAFFTLADDKGCDDDTTTYSMVAGVWLGLYSLGDFIGPSIGGVLLDTIGFNNMCTITAATCLLMAFLLSMSWVCQRWCCNGVKISDLSECSFNSCETTPLLA